MNTNNQRVTSSYSSTMLLSSSDKHAPYCACSRLSKHPPPWRSVEAIFRPRAGSDFMCNVRLSLPLSGGWTYPAASQTKGERWRMDGMQGLEGSSGQTHCLLNLLSFQLVIYSLESCTTVVWRVIYMILFQEQSIAIFFFLLLWTERICGRQIHGFCHFFSTLKTTSNFQLPLGLMCMCLEHW